MSSFTNLLPLLSYCRTSSCVKASGFARENRELAKCCEMSISFLSGAHAGFLAATAFGLFYIRALSDD